MAIALLVALCAGFYSCGGGNDETPLNNDDNSNISNENGNSVIVGTTAMVQSMYLLLVDYQCYTL